MPDANKTMQFAFGGMLATIILGLSTWVLVRVTDQSEHIAKIDTTMSQQTELLRDNNQFARQASISLGLLNPEKLEGSMAELRSRMNALQTQLTDQQREITDLHRQVKP